MEVALVREALAEQPRTDDRAVAFDERSVRAAGERHLRDAGDRKRIEDAGENRQDEEDEERRDELAAHHVTPSPVTTTSMSLIPMNGSTIPPSP